MAGAAALSCSKAKRKKEEEPHKAKKQDEKVGITGERE
jgi:hypothetical protein